MIATQSDRAQEAFRIKAGWQCPECFGVRIERFEDRFRLKPDRFECQECGCQWSRTP